jgi:arylsulfatase A-like enzyme
MKCLVLIVNRCQPAYLGCYGNDWLVTSTLDRLAAESIVFDQHFAEEPAPRAARRNWRTGRYGYAPPAPHADDLAQLLWRHQIKTALIADERSPSFGGRFGLGWESQQWVRRERLAELEQESLLGGTVQTAVEWLGQHGARDRWLLWVELTALQPPWEPAAFDAEALEGYEEAELEPWFDPPAGLVAAERAEQDTRRLEATYAGTVSGVDQWLGQLFDYLREKGLYDDLLIVLTSDCGLPLGEHGTVFDHRPWLHEELVHVPLLIRMPGGAEAGRRVQQLTQGIDLLPTLAEAFGLPVPAGVHGRSLLPLVRGEPVKLREYACSRARTAGHEEWSIRTHQWHLLLPVATADDPPRSPQLYIKPEDRWEVNDVLAQHPAAAEHLELTLRRFMAAARTDRLVEPPSLREDVLKLVQ